MIFNVVHELFPLLQCKTFGFFFLKSQSRNSIRNIKAVFTLYKTVMQPIFQVGISKTKNQFKTMQELCFQRERILTYVLERPKVRTSIENKYFLEMTEDLKGGGLIKFLKGGTWWMTRNKVLNSRKNMWRNFFA